PPSASSHRTPRHTRRSSRRSHRVSVYRPWEPPRDQRFSGGHVTQGDPSASGGQHWHGDPNPWGHNPQNQGHGAYPDQPMPANRVEAKGFLAALFDFSFQSFITVTFAKVIYAILLAVAVASWLLPAFTMMSESTGLGIALLFL